MGVLYRTSRRSGLQFCGPHRPASRGPGTAGGVGSALACGLASRPVDAVGAQGLSSLRPGWVGEPRLGPASKWTVYAALS